MMYTVAVAVPFNRACATCLTGAENAALSAIRDAQVTSITLRTMPKCDHDQPQQLEAKPSDVQPILPGILPMPESDTNGSDPSRAFDPEGR